eukprot:759279-Hanusia_phi.AAC.1
MSSSWRFAITLIVGCADVAADGSMSGRVCAIMVCADFVQCARRVDSPPGVQGRSVLFNRLQAQLVSELTTRAGDALSDAFDALERAPGSEDRSKSLTLIQVASSAPVEELGLAPNAALIVREQEQEQEQEQAKQGWIAWGLSFLFGSSSNKNSSSPSSSSSGVAQNQAARGNFATIDSVRGQARDEEREVTPDICLHVVLPCE